MCPPCHSEGLVSRDVSNYRPFQSEYFIGKPKFVGTDSASVGGAVLLAGCRENHCPCTRSVSRAATPATATTTPAAASFMYFPFAFAPGFPVTAAASLSDPETRENLLEGLQVFREFGSYACGEFTSSLRSAAYSVVSYAVSMKVRLAGTFATGLKGAAPSAIGTSTTRAVAIEGTPSAAVSGETELEAMEGGQLNASIADEQDEDDAEPAGDTDAPTEQPSRI